MPVASPLSKELKKANLKPMDRFLGGVVGTLKLLLIFGFVLWGIKRYRIDPLQESVDRSVLAPKLVAAMELAAGKIPPSVTDRVHALQDRVNKAVPDMLAPKSTTPPAPGGRPDPKREDIESSHEPDRGDGD